MILPLQDHPTDIDRWHGGAAAAGAAALGVGNYWLGSRRNVSRSAGKKVIIIGIDGMDPRLSERMMKEGLLPNLEKLRAGGGFSPLGTSTPPQSPVAWANFINGAGPGDHGIFDFIHRHPQEQCAPFYSAAETIPGEGSWEIGDHRLPLDFWPFNHKPPTTVLRRQGTPFWDYLDAAGVPSTFYDIPSNYPASPSHHGHHRCICGMGTPDMLGTYGTYQHFAENGPAGRGRRRGWKAIAAHVRRRDCAAQTRRARRQPAQEAQADRRSSFSSIATARRTRPSSRSRAGRSCSRRASGAGGRSSTSRFRPPGSCRARV